MNFGYGVFLFQVGGMGFGDDIMGSLATVLPILRNVERLVAIDNRLTDAGTHAVVKAVQGMPALTHLGKCHLCGDDLDQKGGQLGP